MQINKINYTTDMADERVDEYKRVHNLSDIEGIKVEVNKNEHLSVTMVQVLNENGKSAVGKDIGKYITIELDNVIDLEQNEKEQIISEVTKQINVLVGKEFNSVMVVGLGNEYVTPDALGPKVISCINVTRHVLKYAKELTIPGTKEISAISPGVLGMTGIETEEIVEAIAYKVKPNIIIVIDSLASMSVSRVGKTIQLGNAGITPGAGVGNRRKALDKTTLGVPVIAIGVPTVVKMTTILSEYNIKENREENNMIVTPKEIDELIKNMSEIIANSLNSAL